LRLTPRNRPRDQTQLNAPFTGSLLLRSSTDLSETDKTMRKRLKKGFKFILCTLEFMILCFSVRSSNSCEEKAAETIQHNQNIESAVE